MGAVQQHAGAADAASESPAERRARRSRPRCRTHGVAVEPGRFAPDALVVIERQSAPDAACRRTARSSSRTKRRSSSPLFTARGPASGCSMRAPRRAARPPRWLPRIGGPRAARRHRPARPPRGAAGQDRRAVGCTVDRASCGRTPRSRCLSRPCSMSSCSTRRAPGWARAPRPGHPVAPHGRRISPRLPTRSCAMLDRPRTWCGRAAGSSMRPARASPRRTKRSSRRSWRRVPTSAPAPAGRCPRRSRRWSALTAACGRAPPGRSRGVLRRHLGEKPRTRSKLACLMALRTRVWSAGKLLLLAGALLAHVRRCFAAASMRVAHPRARGRSCRAGRPVGQRRHRAARRGRAEAESRRRHAGPIRKCRPARS